MRITPKRLDAPEMEDGVGENLSDVKRLWCVGILFCVGLGASTLSEINI